jgi:hypothetical protein
MLNSVPGALVKYIDKKRKMLSSALVKHINMKIMSWNSCIQYIESVKSCLYPP